MTVDEIMDKMIEHGVNPELMGHVRVMAQESEGVRDLIELWHDAVSRADAKEAAACVSDLYWCAKDRGIRVGSEVWKHSRRESHIVELERWRTWAAAELSMGRASMSDVELRAELNLKLLRVFRSSTRQKPEATKP